MPRSLLLVNCMSEPLRVDSLPPLFPVSATVYELVLVSPALGISLVVGQSAHRYFGPPGNAFGAAFVERESESSRTRESRTEFEATLFCRVFDFIFFFVFLDISRTSDLGPSGGLRGWSSGGSGSARSKKARRRIAPASICCLEGLTRSIKMSKHSRIKYLCRQEK